MINGEKFNKAIIEILKKHGAWENLSQYSYSEWKLYTHYGILHVSLREPEKRQESFWVFCHFEDTKLARPIGGTSGKNNIIGVSVDKGIEDFKFFLESITGMTKTEKVLYEACKDALGFGSEKSLSRFVKPGVTLEQDLEEAIELVEKKYNITT